MKHYVYVTFVREPCQFYIGSRRAPYPEFDVHYFGSGKWIYDVLGMILLEKVILKVFDSEPQALRLEKRLINVLFEHPCCMNRGRNVPVKRFAARHYDLPKAAKMPGAAAKLFETFKSPTPPRKETQ